MSDRYELTDDVRDAFPDEREALRGLASAVDRLLANLRLGDATVQVTTGRGRRAKTRTDTLGWKNELAVSSVLDIEGKWLPLARERLGLSPSPTTKEPAREVPRYE